MNKQLKILIVIGGILLALVFALNRSTDNDLSTVSQKSRLFNFSPDDVAAFDINNFTLGMHFEKTGENQWTIRRVKNQLAKEIETKEGHAASEEDKDPAKANPVPVTRMLEKVIAAKIGEPIATKNESAAPLQLLPQALHVIFYDKDAKELGRVLLGKQGPDVFSTFVKYADKDFIYLVDENLRGLVLIQYEDWLLEKPAPPIEDKSKKPKKKK